MLLWKLATSMLMKLQWLQKREKYHIYGLPYYTEVWWLCWGAEAFLSFWEEIEQLNKEKSKPVLESVSQTGCKGATKLSRSTVTEHNLSIWSHPCGRLWAGSRKRGWVCQIQIQVLYIKFGLEISRWGWKQKQKARLPQVDSIRCTTVVPVWNYKSSTNFLCNE